MVLSVMKHLSVLFISIQQKCNVLGFFCLILAQHSIRLSLLPYFEVLFYHQIQIMNLVVKKIDISIANAQT